MPHAADIYYHVYQGGDGIPVVLIHGAGGTHLYWPAEIRRLRGFKVYALDLPGHGKSSGRGLQSITAYARAIMGWMQAVGLHQAAFVGHSMGGAIAQTIALDYADQVLAIGLVGTGAKLVVNPQLLEDTANETTFHNAIEKIVRWSFSPEAAPKLTALAAQRMAETRPSVLYGDFLACQEFDLTERVQAISAPAVIVCGGDDKMTPLRFSQFLADQIPDAYLEVIPGAGHMVMLERPQQVAATLAGFLGRIKI